MPGEIMKNRMRWDLGVVWLVMAGAWVTPRMTGAEGTAAQTPPAPAAHTPAPTPAPATRREAMLFTVEFGAPCGPPVYPGMLAGVVTSSGPKAGWHFKTGGPPLSATLRPLDKGYILSWYAPVSCNPVEMTRMLTSVLIDSNGNPVASPLPIAASEAYTWATHGDEAELWLRTDRGILWTRARCRIE